MGKPGMRQRSPNTTTLAREVGAHLRALRRAAGLKQRDVGARVGCSAHYIGFLERGRNVPSLDATMAIVHACGGSMRDFGTWLDHFAKRPTAGDADAPVETGDDF